MAEPIPLIHNGITRAWMCGVCQRVHAFAVPLGQVRIATGRRMSLRAAA